MLDKTRMEEPVLKDRSRVHYRRFHNIYLYITERCQLRCGHCYMGDRLYDHSEMDFEQAVRIINTTRFLGGEYITLIGGEPTLHRHLSQIVDHALDMGFSQVMLNSNGISERFIGKVAPEKLHYVSFSLDGATPGPHEEIRGLGTFHKTLNCIKKAIAAGYSVRLLSTITQHNIPEARDILNLADELGVNMVNFHVFSEEGLGKGKANWSLSPQQWIDFYEHLEAIKDDFRTSIWYPPTVATEEKLASYVERGYQGCVGCSLDRLSIFPDGKCYVCSVLFDKPMHFGVIGDNGITLNRGENEFEIFTQAMSNIEEPWRSGCPAEAILESQGKPKTPDHLVPICRLWKAQA